MYFSVAMGIVMREQNGFAKVILERKSGRILGFHIIASYAAILIQAVINAMISGAGIAKLVVQGLHIHPALPELIQVTFQNVKEVN